MHVDPNLRATLQDLHEAYSFFMHILQKPPLAFLLGKDLLKALISQRVETENRIHFSGVTFRGLSLKASI